MTKEIPDFAVFKDEIDFEYFKELFRTRTPTMDIVKLKKLTMEGKKLIEMSREMGASKESVRRALITHGLFILFKMKQLEKKQNRVDRVKKTGKFEKYEKLLDEIDRRGYQVVYGNDINDCRVEGMMVNFHSPNRVWTPNKKYEHLKYFKVKLSGIYVFSIAVLPNGTRVFYIPSGKKSTEWWIPYKKMEEPEQWPTKWQMRLSREWIRYDQRLEQCKEEEKKKKNNKNGGEDSEFGRTGSENGCMADEKLPECDDGTASPGGE